jgi:prepilin-type N-terminal cleavage/methylation domain-containing protein
MKQLIRGQKGFTIVELMIATTVLSVILLLVTVMMISIGNLFSKGVNQARVQDNVRSISDEFAQQLKFTGATLTWTTNPANITINDLGGIPHVYVKNAFCIGDTRYSFIVGVQIGTASNQIRHVLWRDSLSGVGATACDPVNLQNNITTAGTELIAPNSRLTDLRISGTSPYTIDLGLAYGDDDLLSNPHSTGPPQPEPLCTGNVGDQFCATAKLHTVAVNRKNAGL